MGPEREWAFGAFYCRLPDFIVLLPPHRFISLMKGFSVHLRERFSKAISSFGDVFFAAPRRFTQVIPKIFNLYDVPFLGRVTFVGSFTFQRPK